MKKVIAIATLVVLASCGGSETTQTKTTDSTTVKCDTTCKKDSTCVKDSTKVVKDTTK